MEKHGQAMVKEETEKKKKKSHTRMFLLKVGNVVHIAIDNDVHVISLVMRRDVARCERL